MASVGSVRTFLPVCRIGGTYKGNSPKIEDADKDENEDDWETVSGKGHFQ